MSYVTNHLRSLFHCSFVNYFFIDSSRNPCKTQVNGKSTSDSKYLKLDMHLRICDTSQSMIFLEMFLSLLWLDGFTFSN